MPVKSGVGNFSKLKQNTDEHTPKAYGRWFGRVAYTGTVTLRELSATMQHNCTVKRSDIMAVLTELAETMKYELQAGHKVRIDGLGTFMLGLHSEGVSYAVDYRADRHVKDVHVVFMPEKHRTAEGTYEQTLAEGTQFKTLNVQKTRKRFPTR